MSKINEIIQEETLFLRENLVEDITVEEVATLLNKIICSLILTDKIALAILENNILKSVHVLGKRVFLDLDLVRPSINKRAIKTQKTQIIYDTSTDPDYFPGNGPEGLEIRSELCVPIIYRKKVLGTINLESIQPHNYTIKDAKIVEKFANEIAYSINKITGKNDPYESDTPKNHRSTIEVYADVLRVIKEGEKRKTRICNSAKISPARGTEILNLLESSGDVTVEQLTPYRKTYKITEQGINTLESYEGFKHIL